MDVEQLFEDVTNGYLKVQRSVKKVGLFKQAQKTLIRAVFFIRAPTPDLPTVYFHIITLFVRLTVRAVYDKYPGVRMNQAMQL